MSPTQDPLETARAALQPGEALLWADRPDPRVLARARLPHTIRGVLGLVVIGGFLWLSFIPDWPGGLRGLLFAIFIGAALLYALWLAAAPLFAQRAAANTVYAVTDRRVLVLEDWPRQRRRAFGPGDLDDTLVTPVAPGPMGIVVFVNRKLPWWQRGLGNNYRIEAFFGIADAPQVAARIDALKAGAKRADQPPEGPASGR
ncbi:hypothetical protein [Pelagibius sp. 7325]|uniref:hypothetical protein n=1 Tax=Pelagibius sp. 7325 TaxID=3131994 RepID=UPI0030ED98B1